MEKTSDLLSPLSLRLPLTAEEELALAYQMRSGGPEGVTARIRLVESNVRLVVYIANSFHTDFTEDLVGEGMIGLMTAVDKYNPDRKLRLSTFAFGYIRGAISRSIDSFYNHRNVARLPEYAVKAAQRLSQLIEESPQLAEDVGRLETLFKMRRPTLEKLLFARKGGFTALSLDSPAPLDSRRSLEDFNAERGSDLDQELAGILLRFLRRDEAEIFRLWCLEDQALVDVAAKLGLSIAQLRRTIAQAKLRIRQRFASPAEVLLDP